jgi:hypothetical protein
MPYLYQTYKILFFCLVVLALAGCIKNEEMIPPELLGNWKVISFDDNVSLTKIIKTSTNTWPDFNNGDNTLSFNKLSSTSGEVYGKNVTNTFTGTFEIYPGNKIVIKNGIWTLINEPEWGSLFRSSLKSTMTFELTGNILLLFYNQKKNSITFERITF